jgi:hypothetical protein
LILLEGRSGWNRTSKCYLDEFLINISASCRPLDSKVKILIEHTEIGAEFILYTHKEVHFLMSYILYFPALYSLFNVTLREGQTGSAWESEEKILFPFSLK